MTQAKKIDFVALLFLVVVFVALSWSWESRKATAPKTPAAREQGGSKELETDFGDEGREQDRTIELVIDFGDEAGEQVRASLGWHENMTALDALKAARPAGIRFNHRGSGATAFVQAIGGVKNEGADRRNWILHVNGETAKVGAGICPVKPSDTVLWKFSNYRYNNKSETENPDSTTDNKGGRGETK